MDPLIRLEKVTCRYGKEPVLINVDLEVRPGDFIGVVGPSGSGKSTLLKTIAGSVSPIAGRIHREKGTAIGYVPQVETVNWFFPSTVREAVLMARLGGRVVPWASKADVAEAEEVLERLGARRAGRPAHPGALRRASSSACSSRARCSAAPSCSCWTSPRAASTCGRGTT